jgi:DNA (cytosine-5)-methyltransferase 1
MNVLDVFSGIGGFSLGLERAGMRTVAFCEIDPYCQAVLRKHWPDVPVYGDIRELTAAQIMADAGSGRRWWRNDQYEIGRARAGNGSENAIDVICGGFPCQDISVAGKGAGIGGERSGLWSEYARIIGEIRPKFCIVENVAALLGRGLERVLGDLAALGYDAEWHCIPASAVGAPHRRDRVWIVGHAQCIGQHRHNGGQAGQELTGRCADVADADCRPLFWSAIAWPERHPWLVEPDVGRVAHGVSARVDRLRSLGNAVVPQISEIIGRAIMSVERDDYDASNDFARSIEEAYRVIRERKANGGKGWGGWE